MSRSYKNNNGNKKVIQGYLISRLSFSYFREERRTKRYKNGISEENQDWAMKYLTGKYSDGVPKQFRKMLNKTTKAKLKAELDCARSKGHYDDVGMHSYQKNAGYYYW